MKEITRIHLAKTPYSIEIDAKHALQEYVTAIETTMAADSEVMQEIEARMVELLAERNVVSEQVIELEDVKALRVQMGEPREFSSDDGEGSREVQADTSEGMRAEKRFMRDVDNGVLGGVCSGLAAYFNRDVLLIRLIALTLMVISAGTFFLVYLVFWIITPPARTAADKLVMAGKPVTLGALKASSESDGATTPASRTAAVIARSVLAALALMLALGVTVGVVVGGFVGFDMAAWMQEFSAQPWVFAMVASLFVGGVALIVLLSLLAYTAFKWSLQRSVGIAMLVMVLVGFVALIGVSISGIQMRASLLRDHQNLIKTEAIALPADAASSTRVELAGSGRLEDWHDSNGSVRAELEYWSIGGEKPKITVKKEGDVLKFELEQSAATQHCPLMLASRYASCKGFIPVVKVYGIESIANSAMIDPGYEDESLEAHLQD